MLSKEQKSPERIFQPEAVAIVLLTRYLGWYPGELKNIGDTDKVRGDLALESIRAGVETGYNLIISDAGSNQEFLGQLSGLPVTILDRQAGSRGVGRRQGFSAASRINGVEAIMRTEPEKVELIKEFVPNLMVSLINNEADIVVPKRNQELFKGSYPAYMYKSEVDAMEKYNKLLRRFRLLPQDEYLDLFFGPIAFRNTPEIIELFMHKFEFTKYSEVGIRKYPQPDEFSDAQTFPILEALHKGFRVRSIEINFVYPQIQKENEESIEMGSEVAFRDKRRGQKWGFLDEAIHFIRYLRNPNDPKSGLRRVI